MNDKEPPTGKELLTALLDHYQTNASKFSKDIGLERPQALYDVLHGKTRYISRNLQRSILKTYPEINRLWLTTGEGPMTNIPVNNDGLLSRIRTIAENEGMSVTTLEKTIGASKGVLSRAIKYGTDIQAKWVCEIAGKFPGYSATWLLTGKEPIMDTDSILHSLNGKTDKILSIVEKYDRAFRHAAETGTGTNEEPDA